MTRSYLLYVGPEDLYIEMGLCTVVPREGEFVTVGQKQYVVSSVTWDVYTKERSREGYPQQCATVTLKLG